MTKPEESDKGFDLGMFLAQQRGDGQAQAEGEFSVSNEKALEKLAQFGLVGPYSWVLKLLQAVYLWAPEKLDISQSREKTKFFFCPSNRIPGEEELAEAFKVGLAKGADPLSLLCLSLRALVEQAGLAFVLSINGDQISTQPVYSGEDISRMSEGERLEWAFHKERGIHLVISHFKGSESITGRHLPTFTNQKRRDLEITEVLKDQSLFHPTPVYLNGEILNNLFLHPRYGFNPRTRPVILSGGKHPGLEAQALSVPQLFEQKLFTSRCGSNIASRATGSKRDFDFWYLIRAKGPRQMRFNASYFRKPVHEILWLKHGVVVERLVARGISRLCQMTILLSAEDAATDLSGLALVFSEKRRHYEKEVQTSVAREIKELILDFSFLEPDEEDAQNEVDLNRDSSDWKSDVLPSLGFGVLGAATLSGGALLPTFVLGAGVTFLVQAANRHHRNSQNYRQKLEKKWKKAVAQDLERLCKFDSLTFKTNQSNAGAGLEREELFRPKKSMPVEAKTQESSSNPDSAQESP